MYDKAQAKLARPGDTMTSNLTQIVSYWDWNHETTYYSNVRFVCFLSVYVERLDLFFFGVILFAPTWPWCFPIFIVKGGLFEFNPQCSPNLTTTNPFGWREKNRNFINFFHRFQKTLIDIYSKEKLRPVRVFLSNVSNKNIVKNRRRRRKRRRRKKKFCGWTAGRAWKVIRRIKNFQKPVRGLSSPPASSAPPVSPPQQAGNDKIWELYQRYKYTYGW